MNFALGKGTFKQIYDIEELFQSIRDAIKAVEKRNEILKQENDKIKSETYAQDEIAKMKQKYDKMQDDYYRGFPISESEMIAIQNWQKNHTETVHKAKTDREKLALEGVSGGRWSYVFVPTSIGTSGVCRCDSCYKKARRKWEDEDQTAYVKRGQRLSYSRYNEIMKEYDAEYEFQEI